MSFRQWISDKVFDINGTVDQKITERLESVYRLDVQGRDFLKSSSLNYRLAENKVWASNSANKLLEFYKMTASPEPFNTERLLFWNWVNSIKVPKLHYGTPQQIINQMCSLLFSQELDINAVANNENRTKELNEELQEIFKNLDFYELLHKSINYETYSGTLAWKNTMNTNVSPVPILQAYPAEDIEFKTELGIAQEVIFIDVYKHKRKRYILKAVYGKGYIKYELWEDNLKRQVPLNTIPELASFKDIVILGKDGKPIDLILAAFKKNREVNSEFSDSIYGGSDFQGIIDSFQLIDELYSQKQLVVRRSRPILRMLESELPYDEQNKRATLPKEYELDTLIVKKDSDVRNDGKINRDIPTLQAKEYDEAIVEEKKHIWSTIGMAYTTVGLEAHSANISGVALETKEKMTVIVRNAKIRLWKKFLQKAIRLMLIFNSLKDAQVSEQEDVVVYKIKDDYDYNFQIEFPNYYDLSVDEKVDAVRKMIDAGIMDRKTAFVRVFGTEYEEEEIDEIIKNAKLESGTPLLENDFEQIEE